jgi:hypothetical protein
MARGDKKLEMFADHVKLKLKDEQLPSYDTLPGQGVKREIRGIIEDAKSSHHFDGARPYQLTDRELTTMLKETFEKGWSAAMDAACGHVNDVHKKYNT